MIFVIEDGVFASPRTERLQLLSLLQLGFEGWHRVQTRPVFDPSAKMALNEWLEIQEPTIRDEIKLALDLGLEADAHDIPSEIRIEVGELAKPDWDSAVPRLPLADALKLARRPLRLLVEDRENDGAFLRMIAPEPWRRHIWEALEAGRLEIEHGGGLPSIQRRVKSTRNREERLRLWVLFDSDAPEPGKPSQPAERLQKTCGRKKVAHHRLWRRAAENYLPVPAIDLWVKSRPAHSGPSLRRKLQAFARMDSAQRDHYPMREGLRKDRRDGQLPAFWGEWARNADLQDGFGEEIRALLHQRDFQIHEEWLRKDDPKRETIPMIQSIFRRL